MANFYLPDQRESINNVVITLNNQDIKFTMVMEEVMGTENHRDKTEEVIDQTGRIERIHQNITTRGK
jgi:hypothetical protein